ncbi:hypothetical protein WDU94_001378 [Cyamophila willieti]
MSTLPTDSTIDCSPCLTPPLAPVLEWTEQDEQKIFKEDDDVTLVVPFSTQGGQPALIEWRILKIPWTHKVTNIEVMRRMKKNKELLNTVKCRKLQYLGNIMRNPTRYELLQQILQGKIDSKREPGRRRISWLANLRTWFGKSSTQLFRIAVDKVRIAMMVAHIRNG